MSALRKLSPLICVILAVGLLLLGHVLRAVSDAGLIQWRYGLEYWIANAIHLGIAALIVLAIVNALRRRGG
jgi:predicted cation transporter